MAPRGGGKMTRQSWTLLLLFLNQRKGQGRQYCLAYKISRLLSGSRVVLFNLTQHYIRISLRSAGPCATYDALSEVPAWRGGSVEGLYPDWGKVGKGHSYGQRHGTVCRLLSSVQGEQSRVEVSSNFC